MNSKLHLRQMVVALAMVATLALTSGCEEPTTGTVAGQVTIDGAAVESGSIAFFPVDGQGSTAGAAIAEGRYEATVSFGTMRVEIRVPEILGQKKLYDTEDSPVRSLMAETLPVRYNDESELQVEVVRGELQHDFELTLE
jgi:hypothetical protein